MRARASIATALAALAAARALPAQGSGGKALEAARQVDFSVPESPAFTFLGTSPTKIARPADARAFGAALVQGIDPMGQSKQGFALQALPFLYLAPVSLDAYQRSAKDRFWSRLSLSLGTTKSAGANGATDIGAGLRATILDGADPLASRAFMDSVGALVRNCAPADGPGGGPATTSAAVVETCMGKALRTYGDRWTADHWNATAWTVAVAGGTSLVGSQIDSTRFLGWQAWTTYSLGIGHTSQLLLHAAYADRRLAAADSSFKSADLGGRLLVGGARVNGFLEVLHQSRWDLHGAPIGKSATAWSGGIEVAVASDLWLSTGFGKAYETVKAPDKVFVFANLKWGVAGKDRMAPQ